MKKLGKKNYEVIETVEAYYDPCTGQWTCYCNPDPNRGMAYDIVNDDTYSRAYDWYMEH